MFTINFFQNNSAPNKVDKELTSTADYTGTLRDESSIINPVITIQNEGLIDGNYVYIEPFNRYYFVTDVKSTRNNVWEVSLKVDVLMSYAEKIRGNTALVARQEEEYNLYLEDNLLSSYQDTFTITDTLNGGDARAFSNANFVLIAQ